MRLNKYLALCGVASRRAADEIIGAGRVRVNGAITGSLGTIVDESDRVTVDGRLARPASTLTYLAMHKPVGVVTTMRDPQGRKTVRDLLPPGSSRVVPVGRLDYDTSGLLLLTNDGDLAYRLTHPRFGTERTYRATVEGAVAPEDLLALRRGVRTPSFAASPCRARLLCVRGNRSFIELVLREGKNRQVRRMLDALGHEVLSLQRVRFGPIALGELRPGRTRFLTTRELRELRRP
ncbi:MAG: pseudouridine synthase [Candidatus Tyrphobacter sp.]